MTGPSRVYYAILLCSDPEWRHTMPDESYTLAEAAARIGAREDTVTALLPDLGIDLENRTPPVLTGEEYAKLAEMVSRIKTVHGEGVN